MKVKFIGATKHITGSCSLLHHMSSDTKFLVDCGMHQGSKKLDKENRRKFPFDPRELEFVLLTHAHLDHCGLIPRLYKEGFMGKVYCTRATAELAKIVMMNSTHITDLYNSKDVNKVCFFEIDENNEYKPGKPISLKEDLRATFLRSSHILGATGIAINWGMDHLGGAGKTIHFSGDIGSNFESNCYLPLLKHNYAPFPDTDYIVVESTYGGRVRDEIFKSSENRLNKLKKLIENTIFSNNGKLIIPSFSIHRTQEIMVDIYRVLTELIDVEELKKYLNSREGYDRGLFSVYCHSAMASAANSIYESELKSRLHNDKYKYKNNSLRLSDDILSSLFGNGAIKFNDGRCLIKVAGPNPNMDNICANGSIFIVSSGMCDAGPITSYLEKLGDDENNKILITGYQGEGTRGSLILANEDDNVKAQVENMSGYYSAHADEKGLLDYLFDINNIKTDKTTSIFINHGTRVSKEKLEEAIKLRSDNCGDNERAIENIVQLSGQNGWFDLNSGEELADTDFEELGALHKKIDYLTELVESLVKGTQKIDESRHLLCRVDRAKGI